MIQVWKNHQNPARMTESREQSKAWRKQNYALSCSVVEENESLYIDPAELLIQMDSPITFVCQVGDTMHLHQALKEPDKAQFLNAMMEEVMTHEQRKQWKLCPILAAPKEPNSLTLYGPSDAKGAVNQPNITSFGFQHQDRAKGHPHPIK